MRRALRKVREAVLEALAAHFDTVPAAVRGAVEGTEDLDLLSCWLRAAIRAQTAAAERTALDDIPRR